MTTKKKLTILAIIIAITLLFSILSISYSKIYLPDLPIDDVTKKEAFSKVANSHNQIIYLSNENNYNWYIYQGSQEAVRIKLVKHLTALGYRYIEQMGSGYIFELEESKDRLIITSQKWTRKYVIIQIPDEVMLLSS